MMMSTMESDVRESDASDHGRIKAMHMVDTSQMIWFVGDTTTEVVWTTKQTTEVVWTTK